MAGKQPLFRSLSPSCLSACFVREAFVFLKVSDVPSCLVQTLPAHREKGLPERRFGKDGRNRRRILEKPSTLSRKTVEGFLQI